MLLYVDIYVIKLGCISITIELLFIYFLVDKILLETPEDEIDPRKLPIKDLILLAEHKERLAVHILNSNFILLTKKKKKKN